MSVEPLHTLDVSPKGVGCAANGPESELTADTAYRWVHLDLNSKGVAAWIETQTNVIISNSLTQQDTRPGISLYPDGLVIILRGVNLNPDSDPEDMVSIRMWVEKEKVISTRIRRLMAVMDVRDSLVAGAGPKSPGELVAVISEGLTRRMEPVVESLTDRIDLLEEKSVDNAVGLRVELADIRRTTISLRRYLAPQRDALWKISQMETDIFSDQSRLILREASNQVTRLVEDLEAVRERSAILNDQLVDKRAEEMNSSMLVLSVVAAVFLPLGFLTGLLGINVGGVPGAELAWAFYAVCGICLVISVGLVWWFRHKKWL